MKLFWVSLLEPLQHMAPFLATPSPPYISVLISVLGTHLTTPLWAPYFLLSFSYRLVPVLALLSFLSLGQPSFVVPGVDAGFAVGHTKTCLSTHPFVELGNIFRGMVFLDEFVRDHMPHTINEDILGFGDHLIILSTMKK